MKDMNIKETIAQINISEDMQKEIIRNVHRQTADRKYRYKHRHFKKTLVSAAAFLLAACVISIPVQAGIRYLIRERMESIPREELEAAAQMLESQNTDADGFSREYSQKEQERMAELYRAYQKGTFPEGDLFQIENESQVQEDALCYTKDTGCFYLPGRDLTDEELLQIIDFNYKRDYVLTQNPEVQAEIAEKEKEQAQIRNQVQTGGGISEADAVAIAKQWMDSFFALSTDVMEETIYLDDERFEVPIYHITYSIRSNCYYYFAISTVDGSIMSVRRSVNALRENIQDMKESRADAQITEDYQSALDFLKEQLGIEEDFENAYCLYKTENDKIISTILYYYFIKADESVYQFEFYRGIGEFAGYEKSTLETYRQMTGRAGVVRSLPLGD